MKIKISKERLEELKTVQNKLLLLEYGQLICVSKFEIVEENNKIYLISVQINLYNHELKEMRIYSEEGVKRVFYWDSINFYKARQRWLALKDSLAAFGFNVIQEKE